MNKCEEDLAYSYVSALRRKVIVSVGELILELKPMFQYLALMLDLRISFFEQMKPHLEFRP